MVTYNVRRGWHSRRGDISSQVFSVLDRIDPDVVCLQEVWSEGKESRRWEDLVRGRGRQWLYGQNAVFDGGRHQGNAILTRFEVVSWRNVDISFSGREPRGVLSALLREKEHILHMVSLHFGLARAERERQLDALIRFVQSEVPGDRPLVIAGDFNDWSRVCEPRLREEIGVRDAYIDLKGAHARTFPALFPLLALDRVYYRRLRPVGIRIHGEWEIRRLSDHLPVSASFAWEWD